MPVQFVCEDGQSAADEPDGAVGMAAGPTPVDLAEPAVQFRRVGCAAFGEPLDFPGDRVEAEETGTALARRLIGEVAGYPGPTLAPNGASPAAEKGAVAAAAASTQRPK